MDSHRWQRLKVILAEALEQESPVARTALVGRSCGNDADLLREIESLLAEAEPLHRQETGRAVRGMRRIERAAEQPDLHARRVRRQAYRGRRVCL